MVFIPLGCLFLLLLFLLFPLLFFLTFFHLASFSFEKLGFSPEVAFLTLFLILIGSVVNIPLTKRKAVLVRRSYFFGLLSRNEIEYEGVFINLGGAVIPIIISLYLLLNVPLKPALIGIGLMTIVCYFLSRIVPGQGIILPAFVPPIFSALFAYLLMPSFASPLAFISGVLGTLIGADLMNLPKIRKASFGMVSIGGAGVFDGIFLVGIVSVLLTSI
ncbi:DUF1614 domain-containing protein [bacterium]|nr:DUF1614 domain-containing protein [bacterium]